MSTNVIQKISCEYATFSGNVSYVSSQYVSVPDLSDISSINAKLSRMERIINALQEENAEMHDILRDCVLELKSSNLESVNRIDELIKKHQAATLAFIENSQKEPNK